jgi:hypothetical protein
MLSDAGSVSSMESYGYSLADAGSISAIGIGIPIPTAISTNRVERIGGLPIQPDIVRSNSSKDDGNSTVNDETSDVQIPDLDKELSNLNIQLLPTYIGDVVDNEEDKKNEQQYHLNNSTLSLSLKKLIGGIPKIVSTTSSRASSSAAASVASGPVAAASKASSKASSRSKSTTGSKKSIPIDMDNAVSDDDDDDVPLPLLPAKTHNVAS